MGTNAPKSGEANPAEPTPCYENSSKEQLAWQEHRMSCPSFDSKGYPGGSCYVTVPAKPCRAWACPMLDAVRLVWKHLK